MAGVKVTDLTPTSTAAANDVFYIVDTSSNTSKQIEVGDIYSGMPQFESGTFTPVPSNENNCTVTFDGGLYSRVGDIVTMSFAFDVALDVGENACTFNFSLPIATTFTSRFECCGSANINSAGSDFVTTCTIEGDIVNPTLAEMLVECENAGENLQFCRAVVQYQIL